jgi:hypothetical protein
MANVEQTDAGRLEQGWREVGEVGEPASHRVTVEELALMGIGFRRECAEEQA